MKLGRRATIAILISLTLIAGSLFQFAIWKYGIGASPDSVKYMESAAYVRDNGFTSVFRNDLTLHGYLGSRMIGRNGPIFRSSPPGYPLTMVALSSATGLREKQSAALLNTVLFSTVPILLYFACRRCLDSGRAVSLVAAGAGVLWPTLYVSKIAWTELGFAVLTVVFFIVAGDLIRRPRLRTCVALGAITAAAFYWKFVGLHLVPIGIAACLLSSGSCLLSSGSIRSRLLGLFAYLATLSIPIFTWMLRNIVVIGYPLGARFPTDRTIIENLDRTFSTIGSWLTFWGRATSADLWVGISAIGVLVYLVARLTFHLLREKAASNSDKSLFLVLSYFFIYLISMVITASLYHFDTLNERLLYPAYLPLCLVIAALADKLLPAPLVAGSSGKKRPNARTIVSRAVFVFLVAHSLLLYSTALSSHKMGAGRYAVDKWMESDVIAWLSSPRPAMTGLKVYSNAPDALSFILDIDSKFSPVEPRTGELDMEHPIFSDAKSILVRFNNGRSYVLSADQIPIRSRTLFSGEHGTVYETAPL